MSMTEEQRLAKNASIKEAMKATHEKRKSQVCRVYMLKVQKNKLSARQKEDFKMLFVEAKWLYNDILNYGSVKGQSIFDYELGNAVEVKLPDGSFNRRNLEHIGSQLKQSVYADLKSSIKALSKLKKKGVKVGRLKFKSEIGAVSLKQYGTTYKFHNDHLVKIQNIHGLVRVNGLDQIKDNVDFANAKLLNRADGYYLAVTTYTERKPCTDRPRADVGIDMGCHTSFSARLYAFEPRLFLAIFCNTCLYPWSSSGITVPSDAVSMRRTPWSRPVTFSPLHSGTGRLYLIWIASSESRMDGRTSCSPVLHLSSIFVRFNGIWME